MVHHTIALGLHATTLIKVKGALNPRDSKLMPGKKDFGYHSRILGKPYEMKVICMAWKEIFHIAGSKGQSKLF